MRGREDAAEPQRTGAGTPSRARRAQQHDVRVAAAVEAVADEHAQLAVSRVVVGGGLTAATLALRAADRGAQVVLLARAPLRERPTDVDPVWLGHALPAFCSTSPMARARVVRVARRGTVPGEVIEQLTVHERVRVQVGAARVVEQSAVVLEDGERLPADHCWSATGHVFDVRTPALTAGLLRRVPVAVVDGLAVLSDDLSWGGTGVHLTGGLAALGVGPAARNLAGARMAAERWVSRLSGSALLRRQYPLPTGATVRPAHASPRGVSSH